MSFRFADRPAMKILTDDTKGFKSKVSEVRERFKQTRKSIFTTEDELTFRRPNIFKRDLPIEEIGVRKEQVTLTPREKSDSDVYGETREFRDIIL